MRHDPDRAAATYLGGELSGRTQERFERHLLDCDDCWQEVRAARRGRALGESLREAAPARLRDLVRATVQATPPPHHHGTSLRRLTRRLHAPRGPLALLAGAALAAAITLLAMQLTAPRPARDGKVAGQPPVISAAVAGYRTGRPWAPSADQPPARQLGTLRWQATGRGTVAGLPVVADTYRDHAGRRVLLLRTPDGFPVARGARTDPPVGDWIAEVDGVVLVCADRPTRASLLIGEDRAAVLVAATRLGLQ